MSDDRISDRPFPQAGPAPQRGFRAPRPRARGWTFAEAAQIAGPALGGALVGFIIGNIIPGNTSLVIPAATAFGAAALGIASWLQVLSRRPRGLRVDEAELPGPQPAAPRGAPRPGLPELPPAGITARPARPFSPPPGLLRPGKLQRHLGAVAGIAINPDAQTVVTCGTEGLVVCHDLTTGFGLWLLERFKEEGCAVAISPDGQLVAAAGIEGRLEGAPHACLVHIVDAHTGRPLRRLEFHGAPTSLHWLPDNRHLLIGCHAEVRVWEVNEPVEVTTFPSSSELFKSAAILTLSGDAAGRLLALGTDWAQDARVLSLPDGEEKVRLCEGQGDWLWLRVNLVRAVAVSPDGEFALTASNDGLARVWSVRSGECIARFSGHAGWWGFHGVTGAAWLPGAEHALSTGEDGTLRLWDARSGQELRRWDHRRGIRCLALSPDGKLAVTGAWDGTLRVWYLD